MGVPPEDANDLDRLIANAPHAAPFESRQEPAKTPPEWLQQAVVWAILVGICVAPFSPRVGSLLLAVAMICAAVLKLDGINWTATFLVLAVLFVMWIGRDKERSHLAGIAFVAHRAEIHCTNADAYSSGNPAAKQPTQDDLSRCNDAEETIEDAWRDYTRALEKNGWGSIDR